MMKPAAWADSMIARGNARGRRQRQREDPDANYYSQPEREPAKQQDRAVVFRCIKCGNALRKLKPSGCCDRCEEAVRRRRIR